MRFWTNEFNLPPLAALNHEALQRSTLTNYPGLNSSARIDTPRMPTSIDPRSLESQHSDHERASKHPRIEERTQPTRPHSEPPAVEITLVEDSSEPEQLSGEPMSNMPDLTYAAPITPMATPPRSTCRASNLLWFGSDLTPPRARTTSNTSLDRWHEELFGSDNDVSTMKDLAPAQT